MREQHLIETVEGILREAGIQAIHPVPAIITDDCRELPPGTDSLANHLGLYLGDFYMSLLEPNRGEADDIERLYDATIVQPEEYDEDSEFHLAMPLILADSGDFIWGCECYWGKLDEETRVEAQQLTGHLEGLALESQFNAEKMIQALRDKLRDENGC